MKRCEQCDFLYEDDQGLCDMDGHELIFEPTLQALQVQTRNNPPTPPVNSQARQFAIGGATAIFLSVVFLVGHSGFTREYAPQNTKGSTNVIRVPQSVPALVPATPVVSPGPSPRQSHQSEKTPASATNNDPNAKPSPVRPTLRQEGRRPQPATANQKEESKIGGFLKKTGRMLKKPFKKL